MENSQIIVIDMEDIGEVEYKSSNNIIKSDVSNNHGTNGKTGDYSRHLTGCSKKNNLEIEGIERIEHELKRMCVL